MNRVLEKLIACLYESQNLNTDEDILTKILLTKTTNKGLIDIFKSSAIFKHELLLQYEDSKYLQELEELNYVSKYIFNDLEKYFINLNGVYNYLNSKNQFNIEKYIQKLNENLFSEVTETVKLKSEERLLLLLFFIFGATSAENGLQVANKEENDVIFHFMKNMHGYILENSIFSFNEKNFSINWNNKKNINFERFTGNINLGTKSGLLKFERKTKSSSKWHIDVENANFLPNLFLVQNSKVKNYEEGQKLISLITVLKEKLDTDYYFSRLPKLNLEIIKKMMPQI